VKHVIAGLAPGDLAAVVFAVNKGAGQDFTADRSRLLAAADRINLPAPLAMMERDGTVKPASAFRFDPALANSYSSTVNTLRRLSENLADLPERRKAIVFVSAGIPLDFDAAGPSSAAGGTADVSGVTQNLITDLSETLRAAQRANVNIYAFDPGGLRAPFGGGDTSDLNGGSWVSRMFLKTLSEGTGGFAVVDYNDPVPGITQVVRENGSYYLLGYVPTNPRAEAKFRKVEVKVKRADVLVRARTGYLESHPVRIKSPAKGVAKPSALADAAAGIVPKPDVPIEIAAVPFPVPGRREAAVGLVAAIHAYAPMRATRAVIKVDMAAAAYGMDGARKASKRQTVPATLNFPGSGRMVGFELLSRLDLPPGRYQVRFAAATSIQGVRVSDLAPTVAIIGPGEDTGPKAGSVYCDLDVPDFAREPLALSGVALALVSPKTASGPPRALDNVLPVVPTTMREFHPTDVVGGFVRVSQGGSRPLEPATLAVRVIDGRGATVHEETGSVEAAGFGPSRMHDQPFELPVSKLRPGEYLLTVSAKAGDREVRRDVRFSVAQ
jgi:VWFA-related protein